jgi:hypothetical protein
MFFLSKKNREYIEIKGKKNKTGQRKWFDQASIDIVFVVVMVMATEVAVVVVVEIRKHGFIEHFVVLITLVSLEQGLHI